MKDKLGGQIMKRVARLRAKTYSYLKDNNDEYKKTKDTKMCVIKIKLKFKDYKKCLKVYQTENIINYCLKESTKYKKIILKTQQRFKSKRHNVFTEKINKITLNSNADECNQLMRYKHMHME